MAEFRKFTLNEIVRADQTWYWQFLLKDKEITPDKKLIKISRCRYCYNQDTQLVPKDRNDSFNSYLQVYKSENFKVYSCCCCNSQWSFSLD